MGGREGGTPLIEVKNQRLPFHVFWEILIPYPRFSRIDKTDLKDFWHASFPTFSIFEIVRIPKMIFPKWMLDFSWIMLNKLVYPTSGIMVSGGSWAFSQTPNMMKMTIF